MGRIILVSLLAAMLLLCGCTYFTATRQGTAAPQEKPATQNAPAKTGNEYDGTYDWYLGNVHGITSRCSSCVFIKNGQVSNSEGSFGNTRIDSFGNLVFSGPCPNGNPARGTFSGKSGGLSRPEWQGTWSCADGTQGGTGSVWKIFNAH